jgi:hypothetical protein
VTRAPVPEQLRARLHARFPKAERWAPQPAPWELIRETLARGHADGLSDVQLAGGVYAVLVSHGLLQEGRA